MLMKFAALLMCALMAIIAFPPAHFFGAAHAQVRPGIEVNTPDGRGLVHEKTGNMYLVTLQSTGKSHAYFTHELTIIPDSTLPSTAAPATTGTRPDPGNLGDLAVTTTAAALVSTFAFTLPGTTQVGDWSDPRAKTPLPLPASPYLCNSPGNYTLDAQLDAENAFAVDVQPLFQSGDQITVFGDVSAKTSSCRGMVLTCSEQKVQACNVDKIFAGYELKYEVCRSGFVQAYATGARKERSWVGIALMVVAVALTILSYGTFGIITSAAMSKLAAVGAIASSTGSSIATQSMQNSVDDEPCFNVCAKPYESKDPSNPLCYRGGPIIDFKNVQYACKEVSCGPAKQKTINIDLKTETGSKVMSASTRTDAEGHFSYTFTAPASDGNYLVFVKVPKA